MKYLRTFGALAIVTLLILGSVGTVYAKGGPPDEHPGKGGPNEQGEKYGYFGNVTEVTEIGGNVTVALETDEGWIVNLNLVDDTKYQVPSVTKGRVDFEAFVDALGGNITALETRRVAVLAAGVVEDPEGVFTGDALRLLVVPDGTLRARQHAHRTGVVSEFTPGEYITIIDVHGMSNEFTLGGNETEYRPKGQGTTADDIIVGESFVTVVSTTDPKQNPVAKAVVLHASLPEDWPASMP